MNLLKCGNARRGMMKACFDCHYNQKDYIVVLFANENDPNFDEELRKLCNCNPPYIVKVVRNNIILVFQP